MDKVKPTKLTRQERLDLALLCRLVRSAKIELPPELASLQDLSDAEYKIRLHWNLLRGRREKTLWRTKKLNR
jgi:hypothetical protein